VYPHPRSPYARLLALAGCERGDVVRMLGEDGVEGTLSRLAASGVYVAVEEFKGNEEARRGSARLAFAEPDFDNPGLAHELEVQSGGTRSAGTRVLVKLEFTAALASDTGVLFDEYGLWNHAQAIWLPFGGGASVALLVYAKLARIPVRWFSHVDGAEVNPRFRWGARFVSLWGRLCGAPLPTPEFAPLSASPRVARWMADMVSSGRPPCVTTYASSAVRAARDATEQKLSLEGAAFITIGEPLTEAKRAIIEASGARVIVRYAMTEAGIIGYGCGTGAGSDDVHLLRTNLAAIQRPTRVGGDVEVEGFLFTSLLTSAPKILLNVSSGDYGTLEDRGCGCLLGELGYRTHIGQIRSFEKLTGEGVTFAKSSLLRVLEEVLPGRFGGQPTDYQLVEREGAGGLTRLTLMVHPGIGAVDERELKDVFLHNVGWGDGAMKAMQSVWQQADILEVRRAVPISTKMGKVQPFHLERKKATTTQAPAA